LNVRCVVPAALSLAALLLAFPAAAQDHPQKTTTTTTVSVEPEKKPAAPSPDSTTEGSVTVGGKAIAYTAVAGTLTVGATDPQDALLGLDGKTLPDAGIDLPAKIEDQAPTARIFYAAYFAKGANRGTRPIVFLYNGGPGSATMYLHMGAFGPRRVVTTDTQHDLGGPYRIVPNAYSLLDVADLVFIDAPGTGFSRVFGKDSFKSFYGVDQDAHAFDRFIRRFLTKYNRWTSPKYLFGESYGTPRSAVLSNILSREVDLNGVIQLSQILSFDNSADGSDANPGTEQGYYLALPSFAATAFYHHLLATQPASLEAYLHEVEQYSIGEYASALLQGGDLDPARRQAVAA
jgi:carboxypeptidase C (cathepsin A)